MTAPHQDEAQQQIEALNEQIQELQAALMQTQKLSAVGALAASTTHEFNNILTTVINYAKMGLRHTDDQTREKAFNKILAAGQRASKITCGMLSFSRQQGTRQEPTDVVQLVKSVMVLVEKDLQMNRVRWQTDYLGHPEANLNAGQIQQVLVNLIVNARQAMGEGGQLCVTVRTNSEEKWAEVSVRDTGSGIPADKLRSIFQPFFTTKQADAQGQGGTGLGLALCKDIIDSHEGRIRVESAMGKGTTFTLKFPLLREIPQLEAPVEIREAG